MSESANESVLVVVTEMTVSIHSRQREGAGEKKKRLNIALDQCSRMFAKRNQVHATACDKYLQKCSGNAVKWQKIHLF